MQISPSGPFQLCLAAPLLAAEDSGASAFPFDSGGDRTISQAEAARFASVLAPSRPFFLDPKEGTP